MSTYIAHSKKGWTKPNHKYIRKEGNRYIYPEDLKKSSSGGIQGGFNRVGSSLRSNASTAGRRASVVAKPKSSLTIGLNTVSRSTKNIVRPVAAAGVKAKIRSADPLGKKKNNRTNEPKKRSSNSVVANDAKNALNILGSATAYYTKEPAAIKANHRELKRIYPNYEDKEGWYDKKMASSKEHNSFNRQVSSGLARIEANKHVVNKNGTLSRPSTGSAVANSTSNVGKKNIGDRTINELVDQYVTGSTAKKKRNGSLNQADYNGYDNYYRQSLAGKADSIVTTAKDKTVSGLSNTYEGAKEWVNGLLGKGKKK